VTAILSFELFNSASAVTICRAPVQPRGCPSALGRGVLVSSETNEGVVYLVRDDWDKRDKNLKLTLRRHDDSHEPDQGRVSAHNIRAGGIVSISVEKV
jgi:hypothetical protein